MNTLIDIIQRKTKLNVVSSTEITQGYSKDLKFKLLDQYGKSYFLRISGKSNHEKLDHEWHVLNMLVDASFPVSKPIAYFVHHQSTYLITEWIPGDQLSNVINTYSTIDQYRLGMRVGELMHQYHLMMKAKGDLTSFVTRKCFEATVDFDRVGCEHELNILETYIKDNLHFLDDPNPVVEHSDFHLGNLILHVNDLYIIDFNGSHLGSIYDEFYKLDLFDMEISRPYVFGVMKCYLSYVDPVLFFRKHLLFVAIACISSLRYGRKEGGQIFEQELKRIRRIIHEYDDFRSILPLWMINKEDDLD